MKNQAQPIDIKHVSPDMIAMLQKNLGIDDQLMNDIVTAIAAGVTTPHEFIGAKPEHINQLEKMALGYYRQQHYFQAICFYIAILNIDTTRSTAWRGLAACQQACKVYATAIYAYEQAISLDANDLISRVLLGECWLLRGHRKIGLNTLKHACEQTPTEPEHAAYLKRAQALIKAHQVSNNQPTINDYEPSDSTSQELSIDALKKIRHEIANNPHINNPETDQLLNSLAALIRQGAVSLKDVADIDSEQLEGMYATACHYIHIGKPWEAMQYVGWLLFYDSRNASYYQLGGICAQHAKMYCLGDYLYSLSLIYEPNNPTTLIYQGEAKIFSEEPDLGLQLISQGINLCGRKPELAGVLKRGQALLRYYGSAQANKQA